jgi:protein-disulfide isomerase
MPDAPSARPPRRRLPILILLFAITAAILIAIIFIAVGEEGEPIEITGVSQTNELIGGIAQDGAELGSPAAPVQISVFNDLQCTDCADWHLATIAPLIEEQVRAGDLRLEFRHFSVGPREAGVAQLAAVAAGEQDHQWQFIHLLFLNQDEAPPRGITDEFLRAIAGAAGLEVGEWEEQQETTAVEGVVASDAGVARNLELPAQPAVIVEGPAGTETLTDSPTFDEVEEATSAVR